MPFPTSRCGWISITTLFVRTESIYSHLSPFFSPLFPPPHLLLSPSPPLSLPPPPPPPPPPFSPPPPLSLFLFLFILLLFLLLNPLLENLSVFLTYGH